MHRDNKGYLVLIEVLIVTSVALAVGLALKLQSLASAQGATNERLALENFIQTQSCLDETISHLHYDSAYAGNSALSMQAGDTSGYCNIAVASAAPPGSANFGQNGVVLGTYGRTEMAKDAQYLYLAGSYWGVQKRSITDGALDTNFGSGGTIEYLSNTAIIFDIAIDNTYMYLVGRQRQTPASSNMVWRVEKRRLSDGSLDTNFGVGGVILGSFVGDATAITIDSTYMYVGGYVLQGNNERWRVEKRLLSNGNPYNAFGTAGVFIDTQGRIVTDLANDGTNLYILGSMPSAKSRIEKILMSSAAPVTGFGSGGSVTVNNVSASRMALDATHIYAIGTVSLRYVHTYKLSKTSGALDSGFGTGGVIIVDVGRGSGVDIAVDANSLFLLGYAGTTANYDWRIAKVSPVNGAPDLAFGASGIVIQPDGATVGAIEIDPGNYIYITGSQSGTQSRIERRTYDTGELCRGGCGGAADIQYTITAIGYQNSSGASQSPGSRSKSLVKILQAVTTRKAATGIMEFDIWHELKTAPGVLSF